VYEICIYTFSEIFSKMYSPFFSFKCVRRVCPNLSSAPCKVRSGEIGMELMVKEELLKRAGMDGQVAWAFAMAR
jgi:hypothetical protein